MYKHILIPTDGSPLSERAIRQGVALAKSLHARVTGVTVSPTFHTLAVDTVMMTDTPAQYAKDCEARAAQLLGAIKDAAALNGVPCNVVHVVKDHPYEAIIETAHAEGCDLIFMASHGRKGLSAILLGSETTKVLTHSKTPVLVCR
jgi:nucleotide-binding universal stress UspA family protein